MQWYHSTLNYQGMVIAELWLHRDTSDSFGAWVVFKTPQCKGITFCWAVWALKAHPGHKRQRKHCGRDLCWPANAQIQSVLLKNPLCWEKGQKGVEKGLWNSCVCWVCQTPPPPSELDWCWCKGNAVGFLHRAAFVFLNWSQLSSAKGCLHNVHFKIQVSLCSDA